MHHVLFRCAPCATKLPSFPEKGVLVLNLNKMMIKEKWTLRGSFIPKIKTGLEFPPILIPSSGRPRTALLDLTSALPGVKDYVQIVILRENEFAHIIHAEAENQE